MFADTMITSPRKSTDNSTLEARTQIQNREITRNVIVSERPGRLEDPNVFGA